MPKGHPPDRSLIDQDGKPERITLKHMKRVPLGVFMLDIDADYRSSLRIVRSAPKLIFRPMFPRLSFA